MMELLRAVRPLGRSLRRLIIARESTGYISLMAPESRETSRVVSESNTGTYAED